MRAYARPLSINCLARNLKKEFRTQVEVLLTMEEQYSLHTSRDFSRRVIQCTFCLTLFVFQSVSQQPPYMNMSSTIKKKVTLCETSIVDLNTERKDRQDAQMKRPRASRKTKKEKSATNSIKTRFDSIHC